MMQSRKLLVLLFMAFAGGLDAFPETITLSLELDEGNPPVTLRKTGETERRFLFFRVYRMAHYALPASGGSAGDILEASGPKLVRIIFDRKLDGAKLRDQFTETLRRGVPPETWRKIRRSAAEYAAPFARGDTGKGDRFEVVWLENGRIRSFFNGRLMADINNPDFPRALWSVWFGPQAVVDRDALLREW
ncbi:MAG: chalcone isomerase family protein [Opitutales bacterium]